MGKVGAYLTVGREAHGERAAAKTIADFDEIAQPLAREVQELQASRCMYCGVAFCQTGFAFGKARSSGCPLHNLIPEWNDLMCRGLWDEAAERLALTNPLPEFTGRVCPAPCEAACNLGLNDEPTTIRDNERAISDWAWETDGMVPLPAVAAGAPRVAVVGSGPAGLACAWELARRGCAVTLVERSDRAGGLLMYGIPNMKLPKDVVERRVELMRASGIDVRCGVDAADADVVADLAAEHDAVVLAAGAGAARGLAAEGADLDGVVFAVDYLTAATKSVLDGGEPAISAAGKDVVVIGGGDTGTDCVATALRQDCASVRQLEFLPAPPVERAAGNAWPEWPNVKKTDYGQVEAASVQGEDPRWWGRDTLEIVGEDGHASALRLVELDWSHGRPERMMDTEVTIPAQLVLIACGFVGPVPATLEAWGVELPVEGRQLPVLASPEGHLAARTDGAVDVPVYVAGDARGGASLVVSAIADGLACAGEVAAALLA